MKMVKGTEGRYIRGVAGKYDSKQVDERSIKKGMLVSEDYAERINSQSIKNGKFFKVDKKATEEWINENKHCIDDRKSRNDSKKAIQDAIEALDKETNK